MTNLTTNVINTIAALMTNTSVTRTATKELAIAKLTRAVAGALGERDADKATAAILAAANAEHAVQVFASIKAEAEAARVAAAAPKGRRAALRLIENEAPVAAPKAAKPRKEPKAAKEPGKRAAILAAAEAGTLPAAPDFSAETHKRFRAKLAQVVTAAEAGDLEALRAFDINPVSSSPKAILKYRDLAVIALEARAKKGAAA